MTNIAKLKRSIESLKEIANETAQKLEENPDDLFYTALSRSNEYELNELHKALQIALQERHLEVIDLRFKGHSVDEGSIPVTLLNKLSNFFHAAIMSSSSKFKTGQEVKHRFPKSLLDHIDLRVSDMAFGSTRVILTGKTNPDIFGYSVLAETLENLFKILDYDNDENLDNYIAELGVKGAKGLTEFLHQMIKDEIELELSWDNLSNDSKVWEASTPTIDHLYHILQKTELSPAKEVTLYGRVSLLSETGRIKLESINEHKSFVVKFSKLQYSLVAASGMSLGDNVSLLCEKQTILNNTTNKVIDIYHLIEIK